MLPQETGPLVVSLAFSPHVSSFLQEAAIITPRTLHPRISSSNRAIKTLRGELGSCEQDLCPL